MRNLSPYSLSLWPQAWRSFPHMPARPILGSLLLGCVAAAANPGFTPIFDGQTLDGWQTPNPHYWSVEAGAIVGRITPSNPCNTNQYLVWTGGELADFELRMKSRLRGEGGINNGFQFRSRLLPDHDVCGYQVDNNLLTPWLVRLYDEYGRHTLAMRGEQTRFDTTGARTSKPIPEAAGPAWFRLEDWHEYHLVCQGSRITLHIDGRLAAEVDDHDPRRAEAQGILALQLHSGPPTEVQFKDIRLRILKPPATPPPPPAEDPARIRTRTSALAWWPLDSGGHGATPPLSHVPGWDRFELNVRPDGPGARLAQPVVVLDGAYFHAHPDLPLGAGPITLHLRARDPLGRWTASLFAKGQTNDPGFRVFARHPPESPNPELVFEMRDNHSTGSVRMPWTPQLNPAAWHDLVARFDGQSLALFVDGSLRARTEWTGSLPASPTPLWIGAEPVQGRDHNHFRGDLESAAVWTRALTDDEIRSLGEVSTPGH